MSEGLVHGLVGTHTHAQGDVKFDDARHTAQRSYVYTLRTADIGEDAENLLIAVTQTAIEVIAAYVVSSIDLGTDANNPLLHIAKGDLAEGALTNVTSTGMSLATALAERTKRSAVISSTLATRQVAKGLGLWLVIAEQGTPADITEVGSLTVVVDYILQAGD